MAIRSGPGAACIFALAFLSPCSVMQASAQDSGSGPPLAIESGSGSFIVEGGGRHVEKPITVFFHKPESFHRGSPVMMVIPGAGRNGDEYRDAWVTASERYGVLILSPSYTEEFYPDYWNYNLAGMTRQVTIDLGFVIDTQPDEWILDDVRSELESTIDMHDLVGRSPGHQLLYKLVLLSKAGLLKDVEIRGSSSLANRDPEQWIFGDFDRIFALAKDALGLERERYDLFGHSAGGQILHRLALFHPHSRADRILAANSGWYTLPSFDQAFPYGLKDSGIAEEQLEAAFASRLVVFLGEEDDEDETRGSVRRTPEADAQGLHRLARGKHFFSKAREAAEAVGADFAWAMEIVPGVGHDYRRMSAAAAHYLYKPASEKADARNQACEPEKKRGQQEKRGQSQLAPTALAVASASPAN